MLANSRPSPTSFLDGTIVNYFVCLLDTLGRGIAPEVKHTYEALPRRRGLHARWQESPGAAVLTVWDDQVTYPMTVRDANWAATGVVRLDNRTFLEGWTGRDAAGM